MDSILTDSSGERNFGSVVHDLSASMKTPNLTLTPYADADYLVLIIAQEFFQCPQTLQFVLSRKFDRTFPTGDSHPEHLQDGTNHEL